MSKILKNKIMKDKLELKHLAPYLPYKLKVMDCVTDRPKVMNMGQGASIHWVGIKTILNYHKSGNHIYKPILHPLSDLIKEIAHNGKKFIPIHKLRKIYTNRLRFDKDGFYYSIDKSVVRGNSYDTHFPFNQLTAYGYLFEWHFDVFGLIEKKLAIDVNTL